MSGDALESAASCRGPTCAFGGRTVSQLSELAEDQWGLVTRQQAERAGVPQSTFDRLATDGSILERVAHGVYRLAGDPLPDHLELRAAWLQLAPDAPAWKRTLDQGVVSHRSAAAIYGLGHLPADTHECIQLRGLPVTRPFRIASDLLADDEDPEAVASVVVDAIRGVYDYPATFADSLAAHALASVSGEPMG